MGRPTQTGISEATPGNSCPLMYHLDNIWINISYFSHVMFDSSRTSELTCTVSGKKKKRIFFPLQSCLPLIPKASLSPSCSKRSPLEHINFASSQWTTPWLSPCLALNLLGTLWISPRSSPAVLSHRYRNQ